MTFLLVFSLPLSSPTNYFPHFLRNIYIFLLNDIYLRWFGEGGLKKIVGEVIKAPQNLWHSFWDSKHRREIFFKCKPKNILLFKTLQWSHIAHGTLKGQIPLFSTLLVPTLLTPAPWSWHKTPQVQLCSSRLPQRQTPIAGPGCPGVWPTSDQLWHNRTGEKGGIWKSRVPTPITGNRWRMSTNWTTRES